MNTNSNQLPSHVEPYLRRIILPESDSHKGENGKLLIIGGSDLFHAASAWSLEIASKVLDMVFYSSTEDNNELIKEAKKHFWNGVVISRSDLPSYIEEADCVLIGPGMTRDEETRALTNALVDQYDEKKWVIDAGALQMINPELFQQNMIITPHAQEFERVFNVKGDLQIAREMSVKHRNITILLKGVEDVVTNGEITEVIEGGNEGMTKGGTGDVLAGLVAAFFCKSGAMESAVAASYLNKRAGDALYAKNGPFFNATDLVSQLPETMRSVLLKDLEG